MRILVGLSGGVDSAVTALLLREAGHDVSCAFMINYLTEDDSCPTRADMAEAKNVADFLGLPFHTFDFIEEYERRIVDYIYQEYALGRTPNPDVFCNNLVKFDLFLSEALSYGFDAIATGHYARGGMINDEWWMMNASEVSAIKNQESSRHGGTKNSHLLKGVDPSKDQSYFLSRLSSSQLEKALFPIGHLHKSEVRQLAKKAELPNAERKDSQGLCFIGKVPMSVFLSQRLKAETGDIVDTSGKVLGTHQGLWRYTIGQRRDIRIGGGPSLFVVRKDTSSNTLIVWEENDIRLFSTRVTATDWMSIGECESSFRASAKLRYRQQDQCAQFVVQQGIIEATFDEPQRAVTPGQIMVVYDGERVVGSAIIDSAA